MTRFPHRVFPVFFPLLVVCLGAAADGPPVSTPRVQAIRFWSFGDVTRVAIQTGGEYTLRSDQIPNPSRVYFDLAGLHPPSAAHGGMETIPVGDQRVKEIRVAEVTPGTTRIVFDLAGPVEVVSSRLVNPDRLMIELRPKGTSLSTPSISHSVTGSDRVDRSSPRASSSTVAHARRSPAPASAESSPPPLEAQPVAAAMPTPAINPAAPPGTASVEAPLRHLSASQTSLASAAESSATGNRSLVRVLGLKLGTVVIDAGHGGHDTGTIGPKGLMEKDVVLDVALRLGKLIQSRLGADVVYTRSDDTFVPLEERTKIANKAKADLFISIHANSSPTRTATGVETYYFNLTSDKSGMDLATRENATSVSSISDLNDLLHRAVLQTKLEESREFAQMVQQSLWAMSVKMDRRSRNRGVRHAPFVVLIGATMPSILAEIGFVSNPRDERLMRRSSQRQKIAEALYKGISKYAKSLNNVEVAQAGSQ